MWSPLPCTRATTSGHGVSMIPGPVGIVQVAIHRKMNKDSRSFNEHGVPLATQDVIRKAAEELDWEDKEFLCC